MRISPFGRTLIKIAIAILILYCVMAVVGLALPIAEHFLGWDVPDEDDGDYASGIEYEDPSWTPDYIRYDKVDIMDAASQPDNPIYYASEDDRDYYGESHKYSFMIGTTTEGSRRTWCLVTPDSDYKYLNFKLSLRDETENVGHGNVAIYNDDTGEELWVSDQFGRDYSHFQDASVNIDGVRRLRFVSDYVGTDVWINSYCFLLTDGFICADEPAY